MATNTNSVEYTGINLQYIDTEAGMNLTEILSNINTAINDMNPAPDYSGYNLYCLRPTYTITNTQQFAESISDYVCTFHDDFDTFVGTTYANDQNVLTTAIEGLQEPELTYAPFSITTADLIGTVYTKLFTGFNTLGFNTVTSTLDPYTANWATLSITPSHSIVTTWNNVIAYLDNLADDVADKQDELPTFDNSSNCLGGTGTDTIVETVDLITTYICLLPEFDAGDITWGGVSTQTDLQDTVQAIINSISSLLTNAVVAAGDSSLTLSAVGTTYQGKKLVVNQAWSGLYKVMTDSSDSAPGFLEDKIESSDNSITITPAASPGDPIDITIANPPDYKIKVNTNDTNPDYIAAKIPSTSGTWGLGLTSATSTDSLQLLLTVIMNNPTVFATNFFDLVETSPELLARFCQIKDMCNGCICDVVTDFIVSIDTETGVFTMTWVAGPNNDYQIAKYRQQGAANWVSNVNITPTNPLADDATTVDVKNLLTNTVYEFQVDSICSDVAHSSIYESIIYEEPVLSTGVVGGVISVTQDPLPTIEIVDYRLKNNNDTVLQNASVTGSNPSHSFTSVSAGTYKVDWRFGTTINGVMLYSTDPSQEGAWYQETGIVVS